jgi:hypothetical protein
MAPLYSVDNAGIPKMRMITQDHSEIAPLFTLMAIPAMMPMTWRTSLMPHRQVTRAATNGKLGMTMNMTMTEMTMERLPVATSQSWTESPLALLFSFDMAKEKHRTNLSQLTNLLLAKSPSQCR